MNTTTSFSPRVQAPPRTPRRLAGFTLMDLLVGMAIAMLGTLIMLDSLVRSQRQARTLAGTTDAQNVGWQSLYSIERDVRVAGYGFNLAAAQGCQVRASTVGFGNFTLAPVIIAPGATPSQPVTLTVTAGSSAVPLGFTRQLGSANATAFNVANRLGVRPNDYLVIAEPGSDCTLARVTAAPHADLSRVLAQADPAVTYSSNARVMNLGETPVNNIYFVQNNQLMLRNNLSTLPASAIAANVVGLAAQYGKDDGSGGGTPGDGVIDVFDTVSPTTAQGWSRVIAVRIAVLVRSEAMDKPDSLGNCTTTATAPAWAGGTFDVSGIANWTCFRYRVFETAAPVRNSIWAFT